MPDTIKKRKVVSYGAENKFSQFSSMSLKSLSHRHFYQVTVVTYL